jgi:hypothetical protein
VHLLTRVFLLSSDPSPDECEVGDKHFIDPLLKRSYEDLPNLSYVWIDVLFSSKSDLDSSFRTFRSWSDVQGWGFPMFSVLNDRDMYKDVSRSHLRSVC